MIEGKITIIYLTMKKINESHLRILFTLVFLVVVMIKVSGQTTMPEALIKSTINEQLKYIEEKTLIYENYRAIREDMFQKLKGNVSDTLLVTTKKIDALNLSSSKLKSTIDSLTTSVGTLKTSLEEMTTTKNSIKVLGIEVNKTSYNSVMWLIVAALTAVLIIGFLILKRNIQVTGETNSGLQEMKAEFDAYRKSSREAREKMSMDHFNEIKKMRGG